MLPHAGHPVAGEVGDLPARDAAADYRRLLAALASRGRWLGSRDPEGAAQEALKRSLENPGARPAVNYYFSQDVPAGLDPPEWPLDQLFAWLHGTLYYIVREERSRAGNRYETPSGAVGSEESGWSGFLSPADPGPGQLDSLIQKELQDIVLDCLPMLDREYQAVLKMRGDGLKYAEIASRLGVNENTVATWLSRGIRELARFVRMRTERLNKVPQGGSGARGGK